jgi:membrane fusion protein (multidrug efflux system)
MENKNPNDGGTSTKAPGPAVTEGLWALHCDFRFGYNRSDLNLLDMNKARRVARYLLKNPGLRVGVDGLTGARSASPRNVELAALRAAAVRDALIEAGLPEDRIQVGAFGDRKMARDCRVAVLLRAGGSH